MTIAMALDWRIERMQSMGQHFGKKDAAKFEQMMRTDGAKKGRQTGRSCDISS